MGYAPPELTDEHEKTQKHRESETHKYGIEGTVETNVNTVD